MDKDNNMFGGILLVAGTCIGAGMLGLPVMTAAAGFYPTLGAFLFVWFFMTCSALAYLEVSLKFPGETNLISMAGQTLGRSGKIIAWITYLLFLYSLMAAYTAGGTSMLASILKVDISMQVNLLIMAFLLIMPFGFMVFLGTKWVDMFNRMLMFGLIICFALMCILAFNVGPADEFYPMGESKYLLFTFPLLVTAFGYHLLIPTLKSYLRENVKKLRITIILGGLSPLIIYGIWELIILNLIPTWGKDGLVEMLHSGLNPADAVVLALNKHGAHVLWIATWFSFFALTSSFIGVGLGIFDFFSDGLHIHKTKNGRVKLTILTFGPPLLFTILYPQGFLLALSYAGIFAAILLVIYPVAMAWSARYIHKLPSGGYLLRGGKLILLITLIFGILIVCADAFIRLGYFPIPNNNVLS